MPHEYIMIYITFTNKNEASVIVEQLLNKKLIACANLIDHVESHFWWEGSIDNNTEVMAVLKTTSAKFPEIEHTVNELHSYDVPEIIAIPITHGSEAYLQWISDSVSV
ncbi:divalent-cation tolerance protein CutA [Candidatus Omnitrophota bacterium]